LGDLGGLAYLLPSLDTEADDDEEISGDDILDAWVQVRTQINLNLFGAMGNDPINLIDAEGYCSLAGGATPEGAEIIAEELGDDMETLAQVGRRRLAEQAAKQKAEQEAKKKAAEAAKKAAEKEIKKVRDAEDAINKAKDIQKAQAKDPAKINRITKSEQNMKKQLRDIANDPDSCKQ
jgi:hypothetical protein